MSGARFLLVSSSYPFHAEDVHALFVHHMARALVERGAAVRVLTPYVPEQRAGCEWRDGVEVVRVPYPLHVRAAITGGDGMLQNLRRAPWRAVAAPGLVGALAHAARVHTSEFAPDLIVANWLVPTALAVATAPAPLLCVAHSSDVHLLGRVPFGRNLTRALARRGHIISTSSYLRDRMRALGLVEDCAIAPLGVAQPVVLGAAPPLPVRVCWMGRMVQGKGLFELVDGIARVPGLRATLAGEGALRAEVEERVRALGLAERVSVRGFVSDVEKPSFFAAHHLLAFVPDTPAVNAFQDNLPVVCLEALAHGLPLLCTRTGALPELIAQGGGVLVDSADALVAALGVALGADAATLAMWRDAARSVGAAFTWDRCFSAIADELDALPRRCGEGPRRAARALRGTGA